VFEDRVLKIIIGLGGEEYYSERTFIICRLFED
jgi:hypothetical protein